MNLEITLHDSAPVKAERDDRVSLPLRGKQVGDVITLSATSGVVATSPEMTDTYVARLLADASCRVVIGADVTATVTNSMKVLAGLPEDVIVRKGERVSMIAE